MTDAAFIPHPDQLALDEHGRLGRDLPCRACGYNLRGLAPDGGCPECGTLVAISLRSDLLRYSEPAWVKGLTSGVGLILVAMGVIIAGYAVAAVASVIGDIIAGPNAPVGAGMSGVLAGIVAIVAGLAAMALNLAGTWKLTAPDPGRRSEPEGVSVRGVARWGVIGGWVLYLLAAMLTFASEFAGVLALPAALLLMAGFIAILVHLRRLALRVPDRPLGTQTAIVMWGFIVLWVGWLLMLVGLLIVMVVMFSTGAGGAGAMGAGMIGIGALMAFGCLFSLAAMVFGIWLIVLLFLYRARFGRAAVEAASRDADGGDAAFAT